MVRLTLTVVAGTLPMSAWYLRGARDDAPLLLFLYIAVAAGFGTWFALPYVDWVPDTSSLFGVPMSPCEE